MKPSGSRAPSLLLALLLLLPASLAAVSVFDVIRLTREGYPDDEIIRLIRVTDSRFVLSAQDAVRLRKEGVTEEVIREMLSRPAPDTPDTEVRPSVPEARQASPDAGPAAPDEATRRSGARTAITGSGSDVTVQRRPSEPLFSASAYEEKRAGHHVHAAVTLAGSEVLILRDEAGLASPLARAESIARTLNGLVKDGSGRFLAREAGRGARVTFENSQGRLTEVVTVTSADAAAYGARRQRISPGTLASFWAALLNDYWAIAVAGKPPRYFVGSHEGEALDELSRALGPSSGPSSAAAIRSALDSLGRTEREHLKKLPTTVPEDLDFPVRRSP